MNFPDSVIWLKERTALGILKEDSLSAIAQAMESQAYQANEVVVSEGEVPQGLYILLEGRLETNCSESNNPGKLRGLLPGSAINLQELLLNEVTSCAVKTLSECQFWVVPAAKFRQIINQFPETSQAISRLLATELAQLASALSYEQERTIALRPYLVTKAQRGIIGSSRYAKRLQEEIKKVANERSSVLIFGEPGLEKDNIAALIHFSSKYRRTPIIQVNCAILQASGADLFGRVGGKPGLIEWLGEGTLVLNNIQELPSQLFPVVNNWLRTGEYKLISRSETDVVEPRTSKARILIIGEKRQADLQKCVDLTINVPPLRVRKTDIEAQVEYYISLYSRDKSIPRPKVTPEALRRLQSYDFPGNLKELQDLVERAIVQGGETPELTEETFWSVDTKKKRFRVNLLNAYPKLRRFLRGAWWTDRINYGFVVPIFAIVVLVLFLGPQTRDRNFALNLFWAWWWTISLIIFPFVGRIWCSVCPFMIYGEITQKISLWLFPRKLKSWPRQKAEKWGGWFLFGLFTLIFLWEEIWDLTNTAYLSACLLLLITAGAMIFSTIFERRFWCRYLCPIGGMNGLFAKLSMTELRAQQGTCSAECTTYQCYKGGPEKGEGMETDGCPVYSHPAQLEDNRNCVLCMTCLKACPHRSVEFNLRPPGIELWTTHVPHSYEVALLFLLFGGVYLHHLPELQFYLGLEINLNNFWAHLGLSLLALVIPIAISLLANSFIKLYCTQNRTKARPFIKLAYGYLPLVLGGNLAHYLHLGLTEGGRILPVTLATFGLDGTQLPVIIAHPAVISFLQGSTLIISTLLTFLLTQKIARQPLKKIIWQHFASLTLAISMWKIILL
ncbi:cyclic nucleotide-binding domain-containing protein [Mastigocoleus sp. MO_188.B34]|uniref:cyclic nucleotide-binding domain-containing protein n=1 Tax=Mastigocoleus sp. MO_188.B34 TaxID=3036635 RepID=UPI00260D16ED|nr:cyclic nucleotide-binding domain-containing protein [Mastigocoleus sp. MO_188.B34]MDJ0696427.1 sigma 54-interacting transcriptional regulator [Mastigocoleus sp. MO_188.B34]